jgi:hypothetical protein
MSKYLKYGVSLIPLMIGVSAANAQMPKEEREGRKNQAQTERQDERSGKQERNVKRGGEERRGEARSERRERMSESGDRDMRRDGEKRRSDQDRRSKGERSAEDRSERRDRSDRADERRDDRRDGDRSERRDDRRDGDRAERRDGDKSKSARAKMTTEKRTIIRERVVRRAPKRYSRNEITFNLSVGTAIPRSYVIYDVPSVFFDIYPEYRDYDYIVVGDLLLIIDPETREIIDVIEV